MASAADGSFQPLKHVVEAHGQLVIFIAGPAHLGAGAQIAGPDRGDNVGQASDLAADVAADQNPARQPQQDDQGPGAPQGAQDLDHIGFGLAHIGADEHQLAVRHPLLKTAGGSADHRAIGVGLGEHETGPGMIGALVLDRRLADRAGYRRAVLVHQQIEQGLVGGGALHHRLVERHRPAALIDRLQRSHLAAHLGVGVGRHLAGGGEIDIG